MRATPAGGPRRSLDPLQGADGSADLISRSCGVESNVDAIGGWDCYCGAAPVVAVVAACACYCAAVVPVVPGFLAAGPSLGSLRSSRL